MTVLSLAACKKPDEPGCTKQNCRLMVEACRVEIVRGIPSECFGYAQEDGGTDFLTRADEYCVTQCNGTSNGELVACIAGKADQCRADLSAAEACLSPRDDAPETSCEETCAGKKDTCDDVCSGGGACNACRRMGTPDCSNACPAKGRIACIDCSETCLDTYVTCIDACPRQKN